MDADGDEGEAAASAAGKAPHHRAHEQRGGQTAGGDRRGAEKHGL